jgi:hypothetical protein
MENRDAEFWNLSLQTCVVLKVENKCSDSHAK